MMYLHIYIYIFICSLIYIYISYTQVACVSAKLFFRHVQISFTSNNEKAGPTKSSGLPPPHISPFGWNFTVPRRWVVSEKINWATGACFFLSTIVSLVFFGCFLHTKNRQNHVKYNIQVYKVCYFDSTFDLFKPWLCLVFSSHEKVMEFSGEKSTTKIRGHILQSARNRQSSLVLEPWGVENPEMWWCVFLLDQCDFQWPPKIPQWYGKLTIRGSHDWDFFGITLDWRKCL